MDMSLLQTKMKPATPLPELQTVEDIYRYQRNERFPEIVPDNVCDGNPATEDRNLH